MDVTSPTSPTSATFAHARERGYTTWTPPSVSRTTFLKEAVSRIYQERIAEVHPSAPSTPTKFPSAAPSASSTPEHDSEEAPNEIVAARWRCARHAAEIRAKRSEPGFDQLPPSEDRPMSNYPSVLEKLDGPVGADEDAPPIPSLPATTFVEKKSDSRTPTPLGADTEKTVISALVVPKGPQVRDPVDVAVERLVSMGFESRKAKKALAESDTGNSVSFEAALESLVRERKRDVDGLMHYGYRGNVKERLRRFEEHAGAGASANEVPRSSMQRGGSVRRLASQMERRGCGGQEAQRGSGGVGLGIGGVAV